MTKNQSLSNKIHILLSTSAGMVQLIALDVNMEIVPVFLVNLENIGTTWGDLRDEMPKIARAEAKAKDKPGWELIYKREATLNGHYPPKLYLGPLALLSLDTPSLNPPCYNVVPSTVKFAENNEDVLIFEFHDGNVCVVHSWK